MSRATLITIVLFATAPTALSQQLEVQELDYTDELDGSEPTAVKGGFVVGHGNTTDPFGLTILVPVRYDATGAHVLPLLPGDTDGVAYGLDASGNVVGETFTRGPFGSNAVLWSGGSVIDLQTLVTGGATLDLAAAAAIDANGRIVGTAWGSFLEGRAFLLDQGTLTDLGSLFPSPQFTVAGAMNDAGRVVGFSSDTIVKHAFAWDQDVMTDLHDPAQILGDNSVANDVDPAGTVCGGAEIASGQLQACTWSQGTVTGLGFLSAVHSWSTANAINDSGDIVGMSLDDSNAKRAVLWSGGTIVDLNTLIDPSLGVVLVDATGIDAEGRIAAVGQVGATTEAFLLLPECDGSFTPYGTSYPGTGGVDPLLVGWGCPSPDRDFGLGAVNGLGNAFGVLFFGTGTNLIPIGRGPDLQIAPLLPTVLPLFLSSEGDWAEYANLPSGTAAFDLNLQLLLFDPGALHRISSTNPIALHFE